MEEISPPKVGELQHGSTAQVRPPVLFYGAGVSLKLIEALAITAREARKGAGLKQSRIAAALNVDQSTITRFEKGKWPKDVEAVIEAYAEELEIAPADIVIPAIELWANGNGHRKAKG